MISQPFHSLGTCARSNGPWVFYVMYLSILICIYIYMYMLMHVYIEYMSAHTHIYIHIFEKDRLVFSVNCTVSLSPTVNSWYMHLCNWLFVALCIYIFQYHVLSACFSCHRNARDMASSAFAASGIQDKELFLGSNYWVVPYFSYVELIRGHMF